MNKSESREFEFAAAKAQDEAVLLGYAIETPRVILGTIRQVEFAPHPLPAPGARVEKRHHAKRPPADLFECVAQGRAAHHARTIDHISVDPIIDAGVEFALTPVRRTPIQEKRALVELPCGTTGIFQSEIRNLSAALPLLNFPPSDVDIYQFIVGQHNGRTRANGDDSPLNQCRL